MNVYKVILMTESNFPKHYTVISTNIYDAEAIAKNYAKNKEFRFLSITESSKKVLIETGKRSNFNIRNLDTEKWYVKL